MLAKISLLALLFSISSLAQNFSNPILNVKKVGFLYANATEDNFLFNSKDYTFTSNTYKFQFFYDIATFKGFNFELVVQPQIQQLQHQLLNKFYVTPEESNHLEKRALYTQPKTLYLYGLELGLVINTVIYKKLEAQITLGAGLAAIDTTTERLAKGFTFTENAAIGLVYKALNKTTLYFGTNIGHISNFDTKKPNNGYSVVGLEFGINYKLK